MRLTKISGMQLSEIVSEFGNGDIEKGQNLLSDLAHRLKHARAKHGWGKGKETKNYKLAFHSLACEATEWKEAVQEETPERAYEEALDILAVAIRIAMKEYENE